MTEDKIVPQVEFKDLEDFRNRSNNFWQFFLRENNSYGREYEIPFLRFRNLYPEREQELVRLTQETIDSGERLIECLSFEKMWEAYKLMSSLVYITDSSAIRHGKLNEWCLSN